ncbi:MAG: phosphatidate cytidylyltransferase [Candidatus Kapaibacteriota bacterium]
MNELGKRILVAVIGIPITLLVIYVGGILFFFVILLLANLTLFEFYKLANRKNINPFIFVGLACNTIILIFYYFILQNSFVLNKSLFTIVLLFFVALLPATLLFFQVWNKKPNTTVNVAYTILGIFWIAFVFSAILTVRFLPDYLKLLEKAEVFNSNYDFLGLTFQIDNLWSAKFFIVILGTIWLCDTFAYFFGSAFGKHKLAPTTSPKKSWEGAIAGFIGSIISFSILDWLFKLNFSSGYQLLFASIVGIIGQIGDLAESKIKREFNVKDSSNILPGHGGFLDRLDSIMFVFPATILIITLIALF